MVLHLNCMLVGWCEAHTPAALHAYNFQRAFAPNKLAKAHASWRTQATSVKCCLFAQFSMEVECHKTSSPERSSQCLGTQCLRPLVTFLLVSHEFIESQQGQRSAASHGQPLPCRSPSPHVGEGSYVSPLKHTYVDE